MKPATANGYTLVELMVVLVIVAIITSLAWPSYREQVRKTNRSSGMTALLQLAARLELYYADNDTYAGAKLGTQPGDLFPAVTQRGHYLLAITAQDDLYYSISASPTTRGNQHHDRCGTFMLDSLGNRNASGHSANSRPCW